MKTVENLYNQLKEIKNEAIQGILNLLSENLILSVNFKPYGTEGYIERYIFFDMEGNIENATALNLDSISYKKGIIMLTMSRVNNDNHVITNVPLDALYPQACVYILDMLKQVIKWSRDNHLTILEEGQDFDEAKSTLIPVPERIKNQPEFEYLGYHFIPAGKFKDFGIKDTFTEISKHITMFWAGEPNQPLVTKWNHKKFFDRVPSNSKKDDVFWCIEKGMYMVPGENYPFALCHVQI